MFYLSWTCTKVGPSGCEGVFGVSCNISKDLVKMARNACDRKKKFGGRRERERLLENLSWKQWYKPFRRHVDFPNTHLFGRLGHLTGFTHSEKVQYELNDPPQSNNWLEEIKPIKRKKLALHVHSRNTHSSQLEFPLN